MNTHTHTDMQGKERQRRRREKQRNRVAMEQMGWQIGQERLSIKIRDSKARLPAYVLVTVTVI